MKRWIVCRAGGFIGAHLVRKLKEKKYWVRDIGLKYPEFSQTESDKFNKGDLTDMNVVRKIVPSDIDEVYHLAV